MPNFAPPLSRPIRLVIKTIQVLVGGIGLPWGAFSWALDFGRHAALAGQSPSYRLLGVPLLALAFFLAVLVHEAGHWVGSRRARLHCFTISVWWLHLERRGPRWHFRLKSRPAGTWGLVQALPLDFRAWRRRKMLFVAAGPAASLLVGGPALALGGALRAWAMPALASSAAGFLAAEFLLLFGGLSVVLGLLNLLPFSTASGHASDGELLRGLRYPSPDTAQQRALVRLTAASYLGTRPRDWDTALLARLLLVPAQSANFCVAQLYAYAHYLDAANLPAARQHLQAAVEARKLTGPLMRRHLYCEAAYMALVHDHQPDRVPLWLEAASSIKPLAGRADSFALAVEACSAGRWPDARRLLQTSIRELAKTVDLGGEAQGYDRMQELAQVIEQRATAASAPAQALMNYPSGAGS